MHGEIQEFGKADCRWSVLHPAQCRRRWLWPRRWSKFSDTTRSILSLIDGVIFDFSSFGFFFNNGSLATRFKAVDPGILAGIVLTYGLCVLAFRIPGTGKKQSKSAFFLNHGLFAFRTVFYRRIVFKFFNNGNSTLFIPGVIAGKRTLWISGTGKEMAVFANFYIQLLPTWRTV